MKRLLDMICIYRPEAYTIRNTHTHHGKLIAISASPY